MKKKLFISLALVLVTLFAFTLAACGDKGNKGNKGETPPSGETISEVGKKYSVKNAIEDVDFIWADPKDATEDVEQDKILYATMTVTFKENNAVEIYTYIGIDNSHFYAINSKNCVEFFSTAEDAKNKTNKITDDFLGFQYKFSEDKKNLTVTIDAGEENKYKVIITLTASV